MKGNETQAATPAWATTAVEATNGNHSGTGRSARTAHRGEALAECKRDKPVRQLHAIIGKGIVQRLVRMCLRDLAQRARQSGQPRQIGQRHERIGNQESTPGAPPRQQNTDGSQKAQPRNVVHIEQQGHRRYITQQPFPFPGAAKQVHAAAERDDTTQQLQRIGAAHPPVEQQARRGGPQREKPRPSGPAPQPEAVHRHQRQ